MFGRLLSNTPSESADTAACSDFKSPCTRNLLLLWLWLWLQSTLQQATFRQPLKPLQTLHLFALFRVIIYQASKAIPPDPSDIGNTLRNRLYGTRSLDTDDVDFAALRLHASYRRANTDQEKLTVLDLVDPLVSVYDLLTELPVSWVCGTDTAVAASSRNRVKSTKPPKRLIMTNS